MEDEIMDYLGDYIDKSTDELLIKMEEYRKESEEHGELEKQYFSMQFDAGQKAVLDKYISCIRRMSGRRADASYMAGVRDCIRVFEKLGLISKL